MRPIGGPANLAAMIGNQIKAAITVEAFIVLLAAQGCGARASLAVR
jgi:hypothetical protein